MEQHPNLVLQNINPKINHLPLWLTGLGGSINVTVKSLGLSDFVVVSKPYSRNGTAEHSVFDSSRYTKGITMGNFFTDNEDILFLFDHMNLALASEQVEQGFKFAGTCDDAPANQDEAIAKYRDILTTIGRVAADDVAPTAEETDRIGNILNDDGSVTYTPGIANAIKCLSDEGMMGFTLPYKYGGRNCPNVVYTMSNDIISRADASLMNLYGLQGIAETVNAFATEELKDEYLPGMASGELSGAMVLTEPNAGSDLQAVQVTATQDDAGNWVINGTKRFITNGCGHVLLVLARSEDDITDGRGLSLFLVERNPKVTVNRLENKMGINGSPTCELSFNDCPCKLVGERKQGLITYVMALMYGARVGVSAQAVGISEAAYRIARTYAAERKQFGTAIESFPAVKGLLVEASIGIQAARALTYLASFGVDIESGAKKRLAADSYDSDEAKKADKATARLYKRYNNMLTPMAKYFAAENAIRVCNLCVSVLGGNGYMKEFQLERHLRDSRITNIYEGTTQLQVVAAVGAVTSGNARILIEQLINQNDWCDDVKPYVDQITTGMDELDAAVAFVKDNSDGNYRRLHARRMVDMCLTLVMGAIFCDHACAKESKKTVLRYWMSTRMGEFKMNYDLILSNEASTLNNFDDLAIPVEAEVPAGV